MIDYNTLRASVETIVGLHTFLLIHFESKFRDFISADINVLLTNSLSQITIQNSVSSALQDTASLALQHFDITSDVEFKTIADQLWNPLVASLSNLSLNGNPPVAPASAKERKVVTKPVKNPIPLGIDSTDVRERLRTVILTKAVPYKNEAHRHIKCNISHCKFCVDLFQRVNITKCEGHKRCHSTGYYPHVGTALWSMLKTKHNKQQSCTVSTKPCAEYEIPAILNVIAEEETTGSIAGTIVGEEDAISVASNSSRKRSISPVNERMDRTCSWADSVEDYFLKRNKRANSCPPSQV